MRPNLVRAWFDTALNYLLRGLEIERALLQRQDWTWRFRPEGLESFLPAREYVPSEAWPNLDQFLAFHPEAGPLVTRHDQGVDKLTDACRAYHRALVTDQVLGAEYRRIAGECASTIGDEITGHFAPGSEAEAVSVLSEYIVNNTAALPSYYVTSRLWNYYRERLLALGRRAELASPRQATTRAGADLLSRVNRLADFVLRTRSDLSERYDVPIVAEAVLRQ